MARAGNTSTPSQVPDWIPPMLAKPDGGRLPAGPGWTYEYKLDGYRAAMRIAPDGTTLLTSRTGKDFTDEFTALTGVLTDALDGQAAVLDGEIVVYNAAGRIEFGALQERRGRWQTHRASPHRDQPFQDAPVRYLAFDLLQLGQTSLLDQPYDTRRAALAQLPMPDPYRIRVVPTYPYEDLAADRLTPDQLLQRAVADGAEGLVAKRRAAHYHPAQRSDAWLKHPLTHTQEVLVCGWRPGQGRLTGRFGGLLLGAYDPNTGDLVYLGDVGTGFTEAERTRLQTRLDALETRQHPFASTPPREDTLRAHWVQPVLVGEVEYRQFTRGDGRLRHTSWRGLRADREPADVLAPIAQPANPPDPPPSPAEPTTQRVHVRVGDRQLALSNLDKVLYPADGFTKAEVINYYSRIAPVLLPHLADRPVTMIRYPDGVDHPAFFEKNTPHGAPDWLPRARLPSTGSRGSGDTIDYPLIPDLPALVWAANLAALELHVPQWRITPGPVRSLPDRLVFDLDPGEGSTIVECAQVALRLRALLEADGLTPFPCTSGSKGMQLYCPIHTDQPDHPSAYARTVAQQLARETPDTVTAVMAKARRTGKVFIDWSQNNPHKTTISPYSLRGRDQPTVATPITWDEVTTCRQPEQLTFTADDVLHRIQDTGDPLAGMTDSIAEMPIP
jgi:bifunctional non-homologous end joining protein LigD